MTGSWTNNEIFLISYHTEALKVSVFCPRSLRKRWPSHNPREWLNSLQIGQLYTHGSSLRVESKDSISYSDTIVSVSFMETWRHYLFFLAGGSEDVYRMARWINKLFMTVCQLEIREDLVKWKSFCSSEASHFIAIGRAWTSRYPGAGEGCGVIPAGLQNLATYKMLLYLISYFSS
jgi:hypothetical protein